MRGGFPACSAALAVLLCALAGSAAGAQERGAPDAPAGMLVVEVVDSLHGGPVEGFGYVLRVTGTRGSGSSAGLVRKAEGVSGSTTIRMPVGRYELSVQSYRHRMPPTRIVLVRPGATDTVQYRVPAFADLHERQVAEQARRWASGGWSPCGWTPEDDLADVDAGYVERLREAVLDVNRSLLEEERISGAAFERMDAAAPVVEVRDRRVCRALVDGLGPEMAERFRSGSERVTGVHRVGPYHAVGFAPTPLAGIVYTDAGGTVLFRADTREMIPVGLHGI